MKALAWVVAAAVVFVMAASVGIITIGTAAVVPAITEQVRLDPCSALDPSSDTTTAHLSTSPATGFALPKWGSPRHQSLHSAAQTIPATVKALYVAAANRYKIPWQLLAGIGMAETRHGRNNTTSSAGAQGLMQFMPATFASYGVDGNGDGKKQIHSDADSIFSAAHYLVASGVKKGTSGVMKALWAYNRSISYRNDVMYYALAYAGKGGVVVDATDPDECLPDDEDIPGLDAPLPGFDGVCKPSHSSAEHGLRHNAIRGLRCIHAAFPQIKSMGGRRSSSSSTCSYSDHCKGLAVDFMIPKWSTKSGNSFGWRVARWVQAHAKALKVKYIIWDVKKWNPSASNKWRNYTHPYGNTNPTLEHRDHVHVSFHS